MNTIKLKSFLSMALIAMMLFASSCGNNQSSGGGEANSEDAHAGHNHGDAGNTQTTQQAEVMQVPDLGEVPAAVREQLQQVYQEYNSLKDALVSSNAQTAQTAAKQMQESINKVDVSALNEQQKEFLNKHIAGLKEDVNQIASSSQIEQQREHFASMSESTYALVKAFDTNTSEVYYQHCPMAFNNEGAYWLSQNKEIRNPYFGDKMLKCGENKETISAR
jgi:hypothetical protein